MSKGGKKKALKQVAKLAQQSVAATANKRLVPTRALLSANPSSKDHVFVQFLQTRLSNWSPPWNAASTIATAQNHPLARRLGVQWKHGQAKISKLSKIALRHMKHLPRAFGIKHDMAVFANGRLASLASLGATLARQQERASIWVRGEIPQHFGPQCRIPDLFRRRDETYLALAAQRLRWSLPTPKQYHDVFDFAEKILAVERHIGYKFRNRILCGEALKMSGSDMNLFFDGTIHPMNNNKRLALLGDRALSMVLCRLWYQSGNSTRQYTKMEQDVVTRANLAIRGRNIDVHEHILRRPDLSKSTPHMVAETFEAILGAVYVDSEYDLDSIIALIKRLELDNHPLLQPSKSADFSKVGVTSIDVAEVPKH